MTFLFHPEDRYCVSSQLQLPHLESEGLLRHTTVGQLSRLCMRSKQRNLVKRSNLEVSMQNL